MDAGGRLEGGGEEDLEVAPGGRRLGVLRRHHLSLLGDPQLSVDRAGGLSEDRLVRRTTTSPDGAAATVEQPQARAAGPGHLDESLLSSRQGPVGRQIATVLVGVGVPDHHFLAAAAPGDHSCVQRMVEERRQHVVASVQVVDRLEQRHDVDRARRRLGRPDEADLTEQHGHLEHVTRRVGARDDVVGDGAGAVPLDRRRRRRKHVQLRGGELAVRGERAAQGSWRAQLGAQHLDAVGARRGPG